MANVLLAGSREAVVDPGDYKLNVTAEGVRLVGFRMQGSVPSDTGEFILVEAGARAEAEEAMEALDEIKKGNPDAVKKATNKKKRPHLRQAYVRRETADVRRKVNEPAETLDAGRGGLMLSPTHVLEPDVPPENVVAFFEACDGLVY
ncbi:MAG: hypothetical protein ACYTKD_19715, partial [Planctomycetota bacterium]